MPGYWIFVRDKYTLHAHDVLVLKCDYISRLKLQTRYRYNTAKNYTTWTYLPLNYPNKNKKVQAQFTFLRKTQHNCSGEDREYSQHNGRTHSRVWSVKKMISSVADSLPTHKVNFSWSIIELELQIQHNSFSRGL